MAESDPIQTARQKPIRLLVSAAFFLAGLACTFGMFYFLTYYNLLGFRGAPRESNPFAHQNTKVADLIVLGIIGAIVAVLSVYRAEKKLAPAFLYGMWLGLGLGLAKILFQ